MIIFSYHGRGFLSNSPLLEGELKTLLSFAPKEGNTISIYVPLFHLYIVNMDDKSSSKAGGAS